MMQKPTPPEKPNRFFLVLAGRSILLLFVPSLSPRFGWVSPARIHHSTVLAVSSQGIWTLSLRVVRANSCSIFHFKFFIFHFPAPASLSTAPHQPSAQAATPPT